ncbi:hypothetical protein [Streptomyces sp. DT171]|uniref:hypothetical protein n=1 Tax=Streptomyces sp. DT171 TaxID=3416524 RepID=UPI003CFA06AA
MNNRKKGPEGEDASSGLTMLHQAMLHTGTTLSESLDRGLDDVKAANATTHQSTVQELAAMTRALRDTKNVLLARPSESRQDTPTQELEQLRVLLEGVQTTLNTLTETVTSAPTVGPAARYSTVITPSADGTEPTRTLLNVVPEQRTAGPVSSVEAADNDAVTSPPASSPSAQPELAPVKKLEAAATSDAPPAADPAPEDGENVSAGAEALTAETIQQLVREVLAEELAPLLNSRTEPADEKSSEQAAIQDAIGSQLREAAGELHEAVTALRDQVAADRQETRDELAALRESTAGLHAALDESTTALHAGLDELRPRPSEEAETAVVSKEHTALLKEAARVSSVDLLCNRDIWEFITAQAGGHRHFRVPPQVAAEGDERIRVALSGRSLIALLISLHELRHTAKEGDGDQELADTVYERIEVSLAGRGQQVTITLDDRSPADATDSETASDPGTEPEPRPHPAPEPVPGPNLDADDSGTGPA